MYKIIYKNISTHFKYAEHFLTETTIDWFTFKLHQSVNRTLYYTMRMEII